MSDVSVRLLSRAHQFNEWAVPHLKIVDDKPRVQRLQQPRVFEIFRRLIEFSEGPGSCVTHSMTTKINKSLQNPVHLNEKARRNRALAKRGRASRTVVKSRTASEWRPNLNRTNEEIPVSAAAPQASAHLKSLGALVYVLYAGGTQLHCANVTLLRF